jgi:general secretion pathway protein K
MKLYVPSRKFIRRTCPQSGIALIIVMLVITVLSILAGKFAYEMKVETRLAQNANSEQELYWLGRSGVEFARYVLAEQMKVPNEPYDSLNQKWAGGPGSLTTSNSILAEISLDNIELGNGTFSVKITDLDRKVNINIAGPEVLEQAFRLIGVDAGEIDAISAAIMDWIDPGEDTVINGAESEYYQSLDPPYYSKNAPIDDMSEMLLIRGITPDVFWGGVASNHPPTKFQSTFGSSYNFEFNNGQAAYPVGLHDLFTPLSSGRININTASATQLQMIPGILDEGIAGAIIQVRAGPDGMDGTDDDTPFQNVGELINVPGIDNQIVGQIGQVCTVRSAVFEVEVNAEIAGYKRQFTAILARSNPQSIQILSFYWK